MFGWMSRIPLRVTDGCDVIALSDADRQLSSRFAQFDNQLSVRPNLASQGGNPVEHVHFGRRPVAVVMVMHEFTEGQGRAEARTPGYKWG
jgi:hypothetical protein